MYLSKKKLLMLLSIIDMYLAEYSYKDLEQFKKDKKDYVRLFYREQENWDYCCEYKIVESEVEENE